MVFFCHSLLRGHYSKVAGFFLKACRHHGALLHNGHELCIPLHRAGVCDWLVYLGRVSTLIAPKHQFTAINILQVLEQCVTLRGIGDGLCVCLIPDTRDNDY